VHLKFFDKLCHVLGDILNVCAELVRTASFSNQISDIRLCRSLLEFIREDSNLVLHLVSQSFQLRIVDFRNYRVLQLIFLFVKLTKLRQHLGKSLLDLNNILAVVSILGCDRYRKVLLNARQLSMKAVCNFLQRVLHFINSNLILHSFFSPLFQIRSAGVE